MAFRMQEDTLHGQKHKSQEWEDMPLEKRQKDIARLKQKYPNMIAIILKPSLLCSPSIVVANRKYLINHDDTISRFMCVVRNRLTLSDAQALFFFVQHKGSMQTVVGGNQLVSDLHKEFAHEDGALHICIQGESTFG
jgi:hypothetical protein